MFNKLKFALVSLMAAGLIFCLSNISSAYDEPPARVIVQVTAMGSPIEHADVSVGDTSDSTGHNGNHVFQVDKGEYTVSVADSHGNTDSRDVRVKPGEIIQVTFDLGAAGRPASGHH
ncbi:MAG: hypothetical protein ACE5H1_03915 [Thermodesulfobacteriota bacterium]